MATQLTVDFSKIDNVTANGAEMSNVYYRHGSQGLPNLLYPTHTITVTFEFVNAIKNSDIDSDYWGGEKIEETWTLPIGITWGKVCELDNRFKYSEEVVNSNYPNSMLFVPSGLDDVLVTYWIVKEVATSVNECGSDFVDKSENIIDGTRYFLVERTKEIDDSKYMMISLGDNNIEVSTSTTICLFTPNATGVYDFSTKHENAYLGWIDEHGVTNWTDNKTIELQLENKKVVQILCSTLDFSKDTYNLNVSKKQE